MSRLTATRVKALTMPGRYGDGTVPGLWLQVRDADRRSWLFRYKRFGRARAMGLGSLDDVTLAEAREAALACRKLLRDGLDPIDHRHRERDTARAEHGRRLTFEQAAERCIAARASGWKNAKHADQWTNTLATYAYPTIGQLDVAAVEVPHVLKVLEPIWLAKHETARRVRGRIEVVLDWATAGKLRSGDNPARHDGPLAHLLPAVSKEQRRVRHHPAMPWADVPGFMVKLAAMDGISARALRYTILTAKRTSEVIGSTWDEIDFDGRIWTIPPERLKSGREHRVPLTDACIAILKALPRERGNSHVFIGAKKGKALSNAAMLELMKEHAAGYVPHGFRSSFKDWASESTSFPSELSEAQLAHVLKDKTQAAYERGDKLEKRRRMMEAWAKFCTTPRAPAKVLPIRRA